MKSVKRLFSILFLIFQLKTFDSEGEFLQNIKNCYASSDWICRDFERMSLPEFIAAWQQLMSLIGNASYRWFYAYDQQAQYNIRLREKYSNFERYDRESLDTEWLKECHDYHQFLITHYFDSKRGVILKKEQKKSKKPLRLKKKYMLMQDLVAQMAPEAYFTFYRFFFEQLVNVMLKKLNYVYQESELSFEHIMQLLHHKELATQIYRTCLHKTKQASATYAHKMAYHYDRIESVLDMVVAELLKRIGLTVDEM